MKWLLAVALVGLPILSFGQGLPVMDALTETASLSNYVTSSLSWGEQLVNVTTQVSQMSSMVQQGESTLNRMGDPSAWTGKFGISSIGSSTSNLNSILRQTGQLASLASGADGSRSLSYNNGFSSPISQSISLGNGSTTSRDLDAYRGYDYVEEASTRYRTASATNASNQQTLNGKLQNLTSQLDSASSQAETDRLNAAISATQAAQKASADAAGAAKDDLEAAKTEMDIAAAKQEQAATEQALAQASNATTQLQNEAKQSNTAAASGIEAARSTKPSSATSSSSSVYTPLNIQ